MKRILFALLVALLVASTFSVTSVQAEELEPPDYCWEQFFKAVLYMVLQDGLVAEGRIGNGDWLPLQDLVLKADLVTQIRVPGIKATQLDAISKAAGRPLSMAKATDWLVRNHWRDDFDLCNGQKPVVVPLPQYIAEWKPEKHVDRGTLPQAVIQPADAQAAFEDGTAALNDGLAQGSGALLPSIPAWVLVIGILILIGVAILLFG